MVRQAVGRSLHPLHLVGARGPTPTTPAGPSSSASTRATPRATATPSSSRGGRAAGRHRVHRAVAAGDRERARLHRLLARRRRAWATPGRARRCVPSWPSRSATLAIPRLHLFVEPWNVASARTAEAAGFAREATLRGWERIDGEQHDADCFALLHTEWSPSELREHSGAASARLPGCSGTTMRTSRSPSASTT